MSLLLTCSWAVGTGARDSPAQTHRDVCEKQLEPLCIHFVYELTGTAVIPQPESCVRVSTAAGFAIHFLRSRYLIQQYLCVHFLSQMCYFVIVFNHVISAVTRVRCCSQRHLTGCQGREAGAASAPWPGAVWPAWRGRRVCQLAMKEVSVGGSCG